MQTDRRSVSGWVQLVLLLALVAPSQADGPPVSPAQEETDPPQASSAPVAPEAASGESQDPPAEGVAPDPCAVLRVEGEQWIDWTRHRLFRSVCASARWFDGFFGDARFDQETTSALFGRAGLGVWWSEYDRFELPTSFRANIPLPNLNKKFSITVARENEDEFVENRLESGTVAPDFVAATENQAWLAGLGYTPIAGRNSRLGFSVGVRLSWPPAPYLQGRYRYHHLLSERSALRLRETVFWRLDDGFGTTTAVDLERLLSPLLFVRWTNVATISEATEGVRWRSDVTLYQDLPGARALAFTALVRGETDDPVPVDRWSLRAVLRQQVFREWLFCEVGAGVAWPRERLHEARKASWGVGIRLEVFFGEWPEGPLPGGGFG